MANSKTKILVNLVILVLIIVLTAFTVYYILAGNDDILVINDKNGTHESNATSMTTETSTPQTAGSTGIADDATTTFDIGIGMSEATGIHYEAEAYLPEPYLKLSYVNWLPDGHTETINAVTAKIDGFSNVSIIEQIPESETFIVHFIENDDGVYVIMDEEYDTERTLWLVDDPAKGKEWKEGNVWYTVLEAGMTCAMGFGKVEGCLVIRADYEDGGSEYHYLAPGLGLIMVKDTKTGFVYTSLESYGAAGIKEADDLIRRYSHNTPETTD